MGNKIRILEKDIVPGTLVNIVTPIGVIAATYGFVPTHGSPLCEIRVENLTQLQREFRGYISTDGFYLEDRENREWYFYMPDDDPTKIAVSYREREKSFEFAIITRSAKVPVMGIHPIQPLLLGEERAWITEGFIKPPVAMLHREMKKAFLIK